MIIKWIKIFAFLILFTKIEAINLPRNVRVPAIIGFGDSIIDPGNNNRINTIIKCNFPPYGEDFMAGTPTGRFCNGRIPTDLLADELSIKKYVPAYLDPGLTPEDLLTGVSFASGGCGYDSLTSNAASVISLTQQLQYFKEYKEKVKEVVGEERAEFIISNSVYIILAGSDDIANTYYNSPYRRNSYDIDSYTTLMANSASKFVQDLYNAGARRMAVFSAPPIGCVPSQRTLAGGFARECANDFNNAAKLFNSKLPLVVHSLSSKLPNSRVIYIDAYTPMYDIIQNPHKYAVYDMISSVCMKPHLICDITRPNLTLIMKRVLLEAYDSGFEETRRGCCGTGLVEVSILCNQLLPVCSNVSKFFFWDSFHPTEKGYQALIGSLIHEFIKLMFGIQE